MTAPDDDGLDVARGDRGVSRQLSASLRSLRESSDDPQLRRVLDDVLSGHRSLREASSDPTLVRALDSGVQSFAEQWGQLSDDERAELARQGEAELARLAAEPAAPPPDEDDFGDPLGRRRGL